MKISALLNYNITPTYTSATVQKPVQLRYAYNLPCDTVSFGNSSDENSGNMALRNLNTEPVFRKLQEDSSLKEIADYLNDMDDKEWNPNYMGVMEKTNEQVSLLTLVIDKFRFPKGDGDWANVNRVAEYVCQHPDFEVMNSETGEDLMLTAMEEQAAEVAYAILQTKDFQETTDLEGLDFYIDSAQKYGFPDLSRELRVLKVNKFGEDANFLPIEKNTQKVKESRIDLPGAKSAAIEKVKKQLVPYALVPAENDPKSLDEVGGMFQAKKDIEEFILKPWDKDFRDRIIENKLNRPSGFLLSGPPGCGKTYILKAIAAQTGYSLYEINLANVGSSAGYQTQKVLKDLFDNLEKMYKFTGEPSIVLLDELDSIAMDRKKCHTDWKKDDINALLMVLNNSAQRGIIVVGATNNPEDLDEAVVRSGRLDKQLKIGLPNEEEAQDIVEKILVNRPIAQDLIEDSDILARKLKGCSPADISSILHNTCLNAIYSYKDTATMEDFNKAYESLKREPGEKRTVVKGFRQ